MASTFTRKDSRAVGTANTTVGSYTVAAATSATIIGLSAANILGTTVEVDVTVNDGANDTYLIKGAPVLPGSAIIIIGGDQKLVLPTGHSVKAKSNVASSIDVVMSVLELT